MGFSVLEGLGVGGLGFRVSGGGGGGGVGVGVGFSRVSSFGVSGSLGFRVWGSGLVRIPSCSVP